MPKRVDHDARRGEIARAALRLCVREGLASVTIGRVAAEAAISKGLVQHYFPTKEALLQLAATMQRRDIETPSRQLYNWMIHHIRHCVRSFWHW